MAKWQKILERMRANPLDNWTIENVLTIAAHHGLTHRSVGSHYSFGHPKSDTICTVVVHKSIKPVYIQKFVDLIDSITET